MLGARLRDLTVLGSSLPLRIEPLIHKRLIATVNRSDRVQWAKHFTGSVKVCVAMFDHSLLESALFADPVVIAAGKIPDFRMSEILLKLLVVLFVGLSLLLGLELLNLTL